MERGGSETFRGGGPRSAARPATGGFSGGIHGPDLQERGINESHQERDTLRWQRRGPLGATEHSGDQPGSSDSGITKEGRSFLFLALDPANTERAPQSPDFGTAGLCVGCGVTLAAPANRRICRLRKTQQFLHPGPTPSAWKLNFPFIKEGINIWEEG